VDLKYPKITPVDRVVEAPGESERLIEINPE